MIFYVLVNYIKDFTGSQNDQEIKQCIYLTELMMRNIELPSLRTDPYTTVGIVGPNQLMPIPKDMNKPILFFQRGQQRESDLTRYAATGRHAMAENISGWENTCRSDDR